MVESRNIVKLSPDRAAHNFSFIAFFTRCIHIWAINCICDGSCVTHFACMKSPWALNVHSQILICHPMHMRHMRIKNRTNNHFVRSRRQFFSLNKKKSAWQKGIMEIIQLFALRYCFLNICRNHLFRTYCVRSVNAALVMLDGKCKPLMISCHNFLLMTSTKPPRAITKLYNSYKSNTDLAIIGSRLIGVPEIENSKRKLNQNICSIEIQFKVLVINH